MAKKATGNRTYILNLKNGDERKITFPAHWKLTFGNVLPYQGKDQRNQVEHRIALRIYGDSKEDLRGVMLDVVSFRDAGIGILEKRTSVQRKGATLRTEHGAKDVIYEARMTEWVDPDKEDSSGKEAYQALEKRSMSDDDEEPL